MIRPDDFSALLDLAAQTARAAGDLLKHAASELRVVDQDMAHDLKIRADRASERLIIDALTRDTGLPVLSEEAGSVAGKEGGLRWIVDPLDGTINFSRRIPASCVSIGLWDKDVPILGVVFDFNRDELFSGHVGRGAWLNGEPVQVSAVDRKEQGILFTGFPAKADLSDAAMADFVRGVRAYRKVRWIGSAALSLVYVACGRGDVYEENGIMIWDVAGALAVLVAAGGHYAMTPCTIPQAYNVRVTNGLI